MIAQPKAHRTSVCPPKYHNVPISGMSDAERNLVKKVAKSLEKNNELLEKNAELLEKQTQVVKEIDDKVRKVVINTSE